MGSILLTVRKDLVAHIKELIAKDPDAYVQRRLPYILDKVKEELDETTS